MILICPFFPDKGDPNNWKSSGIRAKAVFDFIATSPNELTVQTNDLVTIAPTYIQEEMNLKNTGWAFAICKEKSGLVPLNYLVISKGRPILSNQSRNEEEAIPVPRNSNNNVTKTHTKRVSFGETQVFENIDLDDYKIMNKDADLSESSQLDKEVTENNIQTLEPKEKAKSENT